MVVTGSESPIVVVLSGSMEPAFHRGDLLFLTNHREEPIRVGEIVVFKVEGREIPIVHRVIKVLGISRCCCGFILCLGVKKVVTACRVLEAVDFRAAFIAIRASASTKM